MTSRIMIFCATVSYRKTYKNETPSITTVAQNIAFKRDVRTGIFSYMLLINYSLIRQNPEFPMQGFVDAGLQLCHENADQVLFRVNPE
ncbi:MAG: hypothetical protein HOC71_10175 [Candidatus Latescibacteria bacterium]|nr:hypothetical protein [Candidatus Latescibacterota bacterium]